MFLSRRPPCASYRARCPSPRGSKYAEAPRPWRARPRREGGSRAPDHSAPPTGPPATPPPYTRGRPGSG
eukprot:10672741-Lingulodinium_polyedra.AAC.1